jgi:tyrosine-protein phosphatase YwqE
MRKRLVHVIASDSHNTRGRRPEMSAAVRAAARFVGDGYAARMAEEFPAALLAGREPAVEPPEATPPPKRTFLGRWFGRDGT